ncbi:BgTH12-05316 [Blumeria graminis f. sp. triticale]|uniref:Signal recognition particle receptor subunit alpha homolog n=1 Tax=Blumeria graminis f. sp. triticale TaxID=1689686 RepID=A0A9W4D244_BLUGR|nr:BgTH12-05316 [Blumeria graminis f. sp. triticale]
MLDSFEIFTVSGIVLWSKTYSPINRAIVNSFITDVFIEERSPQNIRITNDLSATKNPSYKHNKHTIKWTTVKELGLIFVAVYRSLLHLTWIDKLVDNIKIIFVDLYADQLRNSHTTLVDCKFDAYFDQHIQEVEKAAPSSDIKHLNSRYLDDDYRFTPDLVQEESTVLPSFLLRGEIKRSVRKGNTLNIQDSIKPSTKSASIEEIPSCMIKPYIKVPDGHLITEKIGRPSRSSRKARRTADTSTTYASSDEMQLQKSRASKNLTAKKGRKWDANNLPDEDDGLPLDYSEHNDATPSKSEIRIEDRAIAKSDKESWGRTTDNGRFVLKDLDDQITSILNSDNCKENNTTIHNGILGSSFNTIKGLVRNVVGGKTLTKENLHKFMKEMEDHLLRKNVAREAVLRLCEGVETELIGLKTGNFESVQSRINTAMESSLKKILTPTSSLNLIREIDAVTKPSSILMQKKRPYVMSIVGVNGVGKSTNLSKICYFLLQNKYKVLVVAGDTFRSGAVEQLAVHVRNLQELTEREGGEVKLYQKGYGKDAANVARDAITFATQEEFDVVLIDTAGRRHNDQRLMSSLEKFAKFANPDKILMVAEALVGTDSVAQARNFNDAFGNGRALDGFIISKCDTVGDMIGTVVSMVHATSVPVLFVGVGQHYSDLRNLSVKWAVEKLLSSN